MKKLPEPPIQPIAPYALNFEEHMERVYIYQYAQSFRAEDDWEADEDDEISTNSISIDMVNLEWLISQVPEGIKLSEVKIDFDYYASSMAYENHWIKFYYDKLIPAREEEYQALKSQYEKDLIIYNEKIKDWKEICIQLEIEATEKKLKELKGKK